MGWGKDLEETDVYWNKAAFSWKVLQLENLTMDPPFMIYQMCDWIKDLNFHLQNGVMLHNLQIYLNSNVNNW